MLIVNTSINYNVYYVICVFPQRLFTHNNTYIHVILDNMCIEKKKISGRYSKKRQA